MTLSIPLSREAEAKLIEKAAACGKDLPTYVSGLLTHFAQPPKSLEDISGPIYQQFLASGMSDDELGDFLEQAKHEMRAERRARQKQ